MQQSVGSWQQQQTQAGCSSRTAGAAALPAPSAVQMLPAARGWSLAAVLPAVLWLLWLLLFEVSVQAGDWMVEGAC